MKVLALILFLTGTCFSQSYLLGPKKTVNGQTIKGEGLPITRDKNYTFIIIGNGAIHASIRLHAFWGDQESGFLVMDSINSLTGAVRYTFTISGDSIMNLLIPFGSNPLASAEMKSRRSPQWQARFKAVCQGSGNGGDLTVLQSVSTAIVLPPDLANDTSNFVHRTDSLLINGYITPNQLYEYVATHSGGSTDTLNIRQLMWTRGEQQDTTIANQSARREQQLSDSIRAVIAAAVDSIAIAGRSHDWIKSQRMTHPGSATSPNIEFRPSTVTNRSVVPFTIWATDSSFTPWSLKVIHNPANLIPNDNGYYAESMTLGLNSDGAWGTGARKWGAWLKMGEYFFHGYSAPEPVGRGPITETHFEYLGENGVARRTWTQYNAISDGRGTHKEVAYDDTYFVNGSGVGPASADSIIASFSGARSVGVTYNYGVLDMYKSGIRFGTVTPVFGTLISAQRPDSVALGYGKVVGIEDFGQARLNFGTETQYTIGTLAAFPYVVMGARQVQIHADAANSRLTFSGMNEITFPTPFRSDSTRRIGVRADGTLFLGVQPPSFSASVLTDTLNGFSRAVMSDSTVRNAVLEKSFARSGGGGGGLTNPVDSINVRAVRIDSTGGYPLDSMMVYREFDHPARGANVQRLGYVDYTLAPNNQMTGKAYYEFDVLADSANNVGLATYEITIVNSGGGGNMSTSKMVIGNGDLAGVSQYTGQLGRNPTPVATLYTSGTSSATNRVTMRISTVGAYIYDGMTVYLRIHFSCTRGSTSTWWVRPASGRGINP